jgi:hypothetical protein
MHEHLELFVSVGSSGRFMPGGPKGERRLAPHSPLRTRAARVAPVIGLNLCHDAVIFPTR